MCLCGWPVDCRFFRSHFRRLFIVSPWQDNNKERLLGVSVGYTPWSKSIIHQFNSCSVKFSSIKNIQEYLALTKTPRWFNRQEGSVSTVFICMYFVHWSRPVPALLSPWSVLVGASERLPPIWGRDSTIANGRLPPFLTPPVSLLSMSPTMIQKTAEAKGPSESTVTHVPSKLDDPSACSKAPHLCWPHFSCHIAVVSCFPWPLAGRLSAVPESTYSSMFPKPQRTLLSVPWP